MTSGRLFADIDDARSLAQAIVDTVREPLLVLDKELRVVAASRSFYLTFRVNREETQGQLLYSLGDGQWDIPALRTLLGKIVPEHAVLDDYQVEHKFPHIGHRTMLLNARKVFYEDNAHTTVLLAIEDITERKAAERETAGIIAAKRASFGGDAASDRQQPADHRKHHHAEGANGAVAGNASAPGRRPQARHVGRCGPAASSSLWARRTDRGCSPTYRNCAQLWRNR